MDDFDLKLDDSLNKIGKDGVIDKLQKQMLHHADLQSQLENSKDEISVLFDELMSKLVLSVRKRMPKLSISVSSNRCDIRYKSKAVILIPNLNKLEWSVEPNDMGKEFMKVFSNTFKMSDNMSDIADAIVDYFTGRYKTLNRGN